MKSLEQAPAIRFQGLTLILTGLAALPHTMHLPLWVSLFFCVLLVWRLLSLKFANLIPGRILLIALTFLGVLLVYNHHQTLLGRDAGVSLLITMLGLKLMELHKTRDIYVSSFMGYFILVTHFLYSQSFYLTVYLLCLLICITTLLLLINRTRPSKQLLEPFGKTLFITLQAIPIAFVLFFLFPRLSHPLWDFGGAMGSGITGLDDRVSPGSISQLIQSPSVAFRARFFGDLPENKDRYWRALVLWDTDGTEWFNALQPEPMHDLPIMKGSGSVYDYELMLEPHQQKWLFSLDYPIKAPEGMLTSDFQLIAERNINRAIRYRMQSHTEIPFQKASRQELTRALKLPANITKRQYNLVQSWKNQAASQTEVISLALHHFNQHPFVYTLTPPLYQKNPVDQFLFEDREGFCEHYASSFIQLMRIAGIPSRMVLGYQGGEFNPLGDYFIIRQSDAHAWAEVWLRGNGWTRIDPTAAVAPERIRHPMQLDFSRIGNPVLFQIDGGGLLGSITDQIRHAFDAVNLGWKQWIIGYNRTRQSNLLRHIGLDFTHRWERAGLLVFLVGTVLLLSIFTLLRKGKVPKDPVVMGYDRLCRKLAKIGLTRKSNEGPLDYSRRVAKLRPDLAADTQRLIGSYIRLRYAESPSRQIRHYFLYRVNRFRPKKSCS